MLAKSIDEKKKVTDELEKIRDNLAKSKSALTTEETQVESISKLLADEEDAAAKAKFVSAKEAAVKKVTDLRAHIVLGEKLVITKEARIKNIQGKLDTALPEVKMRAEDLVLQVKLAAQQKEKEKQLAD